MPSLPAALEALNRGPTSEAGRDVLQALGGSELLFLSAERQSPSDPLRLAFSRDRNNRMVLPAFTDEKHLRAFAPQGGPVVKARAHDFIPAALQGPFHGIALNPGSESGAIVSREGLELISRQGTPAIKVEDGRHVEVW